MLLTMARHPFLVFLSASFFAFPSLSQSIRDSSEQSPNPLYSITARDLGVGECNAASPCVNGACCGPNNLCGYGPKFCGDGCQHNCDAKAECGPYAADGHMKCPLNVCCSQFGFCGSTSDFCGTGCQQGYGGCGDVNRPSCGSGGSGGVSKRTIGYYETWSNTRKCQSVSPEDLNLDGYTHLNFAFASFSDSAPFGISGMDDNAQSLFSRFTSLKSKKSGLQTWISIGGWSFTDPGPTRTAFSDMASSASNRQQFINGLVQFMKTYGFDGADIDWEYPVADDRGGKTEDMANYVALVKDMRSAFGSQYGLSVTLPTSYWYLQHFSLIDMQDSVDWFNLMSYDLHGVWDADSKYVGPYIAPHTNLTEIDMGLDLLWRAGVSSNKVVLGQGFYGRSFTLKDPSCNTPNGQCQFSGGADPGPCSAASGILDDQEIQDIIQQNSLTPIHDETAGVKWITWNNNQWVSYDDVDTFKQKADFAANRCLGGLMVWAIDQVDQSAQPQIGNSASAGVTSDQQSDVNSIAANQKASQSCYTSDCNQKCKRGTTGVAQFNGQPGSLSTNDRCPKNHYRNLCCDDGTIVDQCQWRGYRGAGLSCIGGCADGETEVTKNTNSHDSKTGDRNCNGGTQTYCCKTFKPPPSKKDLEQDAEDGLKSAAETAAENAALDLAAKAFCRVAVPALLLPLELLEDAIPIIGEILDIAEIAATPALIQGCVKGIEKEGKAEFKVFGKKHTLSMDEPSAKPTERPPSSSHDPPKTSECPIASADSSKRLARRAGKRDCNGGGADPETFYEAANPATTIENPTPKPVECDGNRWPQVCAFLGYDPPMDSSRLYNDLTSAEQACLHYKSVIDHHPQYATLTCPTYNIGRTSAPEVRQYYNQHNSAWRDTVGACDADEYPPALFFKGRPGAWIRWLPASQNRGGGQLWRGYCQKTAIKTVGSKLSVRDYKGKAVTDKTFTTQFMERRFSMRFINMPVQAAGDPDGISANPCWPRRYQTYGAEPGFALLTQDAWYQGPQANQNANSAQYAGMPPGPPMKRRDLPYGWIDPDEFIFNDGNSTRKATDEELAEEFGMYRCEDDSCAEEMELLGIQSAVTIDMNAAATPVAVAAGATTIAASNIVARQTAAAASRFDARGVNDSNMAAGVSRNGLNPGLPAVTPFASLDNAVS